MSKKYETFCLVPCSQFNLAFLFQLVSGLTKRSPAFRRWRSESGRLLKFLPKGWPPCPIQARILIESRSPRLDLQ